MVMIMLTTTTTTTTIAGIDDDYNDDEGDDYVFYRLPSFNGNMKVFLAVLLLAFAAYVSAECGELERFKVKHQWSEAFGTGHERVKFGLKLWQSIIHDHADIRKVFERVRGDNLYSSDFLAHSMRVLSGLDMTISLLDRPTFLDAQLAHLKSQHDSRPILPEYYDFFRIHLVEVLSETLETHLDFGAWNECISLITSGIKG